MRFSQISEYSVLCITLAKERKEGKTLTLGSHFYITMSFWVMFTLSTLYFTIVDWPLTMHIKQWKGMLFLVEQALWGGNMSSPKNTCVGG